MSTEQILGRDVLVSPFVTHHAGCEHTILRYGPNGEPWLFWRHPDGQWVTECEVSLPADRRALPAESPEPVAWEYRKRRLNQAGKPVGKWERGVSFYPMGTDDSWWEVENVPLVRAQESENDVE